MGKIHQKVVFLEQKERNLELFQKLINDVLKRIFWRESLLLLTTKLALYLLKFINHFCT
jgi:hypothetical protein